MTTSFLICARFFHLGSGMILVGVVAFRWLILLPAFSGEADETWQKLTSLFLSLNQLFVWSGVILVTSGLALFWAVSAGMSDTSLMESLNWDTFETVLFQTNFGGVFQWKLGLAVLLGIILWRLTKGKWLTRRNRSWLETTAGLTASAMVVSFSLTGHAAAGSGPGTVWRILADATHLFAASIWPAGLLPFALFLGSFRRMNEPFIFRPIMAAVRRFSDVSFIAVGVLMISGIINTCFIVGSFSAMVITDYGKLLCLKLFLFLLILGIATINRYRLVPMISSRTATSEERSAVDLLRRLQLFVTTEFSLAVAIVAVVSILGITPPPR